MSAVKIRKKLKKSEFSDSEGSKLLLSLLSIQNSKYCSSESHPIIQLNIGCFNSCYKEKPEIMELRQRLKSSQAKRPSCQWCRKISLEIRQFVNLQQISSWNLWRKKIYEGKATSKYDYLNVTEDTKFLEGWAWVGSDWWKNLVK